MRDLKERAIIELLQEKATGKEGCARDYARERVFTAIRNEGIIPIERVSTRCFLIDLLEIHVI